MTAEIENQTNIEIKDEDTKNILQSEEWQTIIPTKESIIANIKETLPTTSQKPKEVALPNTEITSKEKEDTQKEKEDTQKDKEDTQKDKEDTQKDIEENPKNGDLKESNINETNDQIGIQKNANKEDSSKKLELPELTKRKVPSSSVRREPRPSTSKDFDPPFIADDYSDQEKSDSQSDRSNYSEYSESEDSDFFDREVSVNRSRKRRKSSTSRKPKRRKRNPYEHDIAYRTQVNVDSNGSPRQTRGKRVAVYDGSESDSEFEKYLISASEKASRRAAETKKIVEDGGENSNSSKTSNRTTELDKSDSGEKVDDKKRKPRRVKQTILNTDEFHKKYDELEEEYVHLDKQSGENSLQIDSNVSPKSLDFELFLADSNDSTSKLASSEIEGRQSRTKSSSQGESFQSDLFCWYCKRYFSKQNLYWRHIQSHVKSPQVKVKRIRQSEIERHCGPDYDYNYYSKMSLKLTLKSNENQEFEIINKSPTDQGPSEGRDETQNKNGDAQNLSSGKEQTNLLNKTEKSNTESESASNEKLTTKTPPPITKPPQLRVRTNLLQNPNGNNAENLLQTRNLPHVNGETLQTFHNFPQNANLWCAQSGIVNGDKEQDTQRDLLRSILEANANAGNLASNSDSNIAEYVPLDRLSHICPLCSQRFVDAKSLEVHKRTIHQCSDVSNGPPVVQQQIRVQHNVIVNNVIQQSPMHSPYYGQSQQNLINNSMQQLAQQVNRLPVPNSGYPYRPQMSLEYRTNQNPPVYPNANMSGINNRPPMNHMFQQPNYRLPPPPGYYANNQMPPMSNANVPHGSMNPSQPMYMRAGMNARPQMPKNYPPSAMGNRMRSPELVTSQPQGTVIVSPPTPTVRSAGVPQPRRRSANPVNIRPKGAMMQPSIPNAAMGLTPRGRRPSLPNNNGKPMGPSSTNKPNQQEMLIRTREMDPDCTVIAVQNFNDGLPVIQNIQGNVSMDTDDNSHNSSNRLTENSQPAAVANILATRGITVLPASKSISPQNRKDQEKTPPPQNSSAINLNSDVSIIPTNKNSSSVNYTTTNAKRPDRPISTIDLTDENRAIKVTRKPTQTLVRKNKRFKCSICPKQFNNSDMYASHVTKHKTLPFRCQKCGAAYPKAEGLMIHSKNCKKAPAASENTPTPASPATGSNFGIPLLNLRQLNTQMLKRIGIKSYIPLGKDGQFGVPIASLDNIPTVQQSNLLTTGLTNILSLGSIRTLN